MKSFLSSLLALGVAACATPPLPDLSPADASSPTAVSEPAPYQPVLAGTAAHMPVAVKPWREVNDRVAPGAEGKQ